MWSSLYLDQWVTACRVSTGKIQEVILQEHLEKEDEVLVSLAGLKQVCVSNTCVDYTLLTCVCLPSALTSAAGVALDPVRSRTS